MNEKKTSNNQIAPNIATKHLKNVNNHLYNHIITSGEQKAFLRKTTTNSLEGMTE